jgi:protoheme IX farnesyltransferase
VTKDTLKRYYQLTKPGIVYGNALHVVVGYLLAFRFGLHWVTFFGVFFGVALIIASACVANNYMDRGIDAYMKRTKKRALVVGVIEARNAIIYAVVLAAIGVALLMATTNLLTVTLGAVAYVWYVWIYGYAKRTTYYSTIVGSVPGALPLVAGYTAATNTFDTAAWVLFAMLCLWQIPHFYAIAIARKKEYASASVPIITAYKSNDTIRRHMFVWTALYGASIVLLAALGVVHVFAAVLWLLVAVYWVWHMLQAYPHPSVESWAMRSFRLSLLMPITLMLAAVSTVVLG